MHKYVHYMFFSSQFGVAYHYVTEEIFSQFVHNVEGNYKDCVAVMDSCFPSLGCLQIKFVSLHEVILGVH